MVDCYILDEERRPKPVTLEEWVIWFSTHDRRVALTETEMFRVSTVFLGLNHRFGQKGPPLVFETMVFDMHPHKAKVLGQEMLMYQDHDQFRYSTWDDAIAGHEAAVTRCRLKEQEAKSATEKVMAGKE